jgi:hypothetical protein
MRLLLLVVRLTGYGLKRVSHGMGALMYAMNVPIQCIGF